MQYFKLSKQGQSAIEYLMTYGWMLLVVAVVGGAIFATVGGQNVDSVTGFTGSDILINEFGLTSSGDIQFDLRNGGSETLHISEINISDSGTGNYISKQFTGDTKVGVGNSRIFSLPNLSRSSSAKDLNLQVRYDHGGLSNLTAQGTLSGSFEVKETVTTSGSATEEDSSTGIQIIDNFEDGDLAEYTQIDGVLTNQAAGSYNGDYRLETDVAAYEQGFFVSENSSGGTLPMYPEPGDKVSFRVYMENVTTDQIWINTGDSASETYEVMFDVLNNELILENSSTQTSTTFSQTPTSNSWITIEFVWGDSGILEARWRDENGNIIDQVSTTDTTYNTGGEYLSITAYIGSESDPTYVDYITIEPIN